MFTEHEIKAQRMGFDSKEYNTKEEMITQRQATLREMVAPTPIKKTRKAVTRRRIIIESERLNEINTDITIGEKQKQTLKLFASEVHEIYECNIILGTSDQEWKVKKSTIKEILKHRGMEDSVPNCIQITESNRKVSVTFKTNLSKEDFRLKEVSTWMKEEQRYLAFERKGIQSQRSQQGDFHRHQKKFIKRRQQEWTY